jgi:hypothetical protein
MTKTATYRQEDIFQEIPGDDKNILMKIPPEVCKKMGWEPGDRLSITQGEDGSISVKKIKNG